MLADPLSTLLIGGVLLSLWLVSVGVYRITFHPAAKYPGPLIAKVTDLYSVYYATRGDAHGKLQKLHYRYGPIVRLGPDKIAFCSDTALQTIYNSRKVCKSQGYAAMDPVPGACNTHTAIDAGVHRAKRKAIEPAFSDQSLRAFEPIIWKQADVFEAQLRTLARQDKAGLGWSMPINVAAACRHFTLDTIGAFAFGKSFDLQSDTRNRGMIDAMRAAMYVTGIVYNYPMLKAWGLSKWISVNGGWTQQQWGALSKGLIEQRLSRTVDARADMFAFVLGSRHETDDIEISIGDLWAEARLALLAGTDTTSAALAAVFFYLSRYPIKLNMLERELRSTFGSADDIRAGVKLAQCKYLKAVIDESMRLSPPIAIPLWREVMPEGLTVDGEYIPGGLNVAVSLHCLFKSAVCFPEPLRFLPERWLENGNPHLEYLEAARHTFRPFSLGSRKCVGAGLANLELNLLLARVVWGFEICRPAGPAADIGAGYFEDAQGRQSDFAEYQSIHHFTPETEGPFLQFRERKV